MTDLDTRPPVIASEGAVMVKLMMPSRDDIQEGRQPPLHEIERDLRPMEIHDWADGTETCEPLKDEPPMKFRKRTIKRVPSPATKRGGG